MVTIPTIIINEDDGKILENFLSIQAVQAKQLSLSVTFEMVEH